MKIGILQCDDVIDDLQPSFDNYPKMFTRIFQALVPEWQFVTYKVHKGELPSIEACDGYLSTGSRYGVNDDFEWIRNFIRYVALLAQSGKPYFGVCFGHQALAVALKGKVSLSNKGWGIGIYKNDVVQNQPWMQPHSAHLNLVASHQDQITELPKNGEVLARSEFCPYYLVQYADHLMSVQGHPEFSKGYSRALMNYRKEDFSDAVISQATKSLSQDADGLLMIQWVIQFFKQASR